MFSEISLNILDIAQNSIRASASLIEITVEIFQNIDRMRVQIIDNGCGMTEKQLQQAQDPFFTTRTTRKMGFGLSFFKLNSEITGGSFHIESKLSYGTQVTADFILSHIDRMPLGNISATIHALITANPELDFVYTYGFNGRSFTLDTREMRMTLGEIPFNVPEVSLFIKEYLEENKKDVDGRVNL